MTLKQHNLFTLNIMAQSHWFFVYAFVFFLTSTHEKDYYEVSMENAIPIYILTYSLDLVHGVFQLNTLVGTFPKLQHIIIVGVNDNEF